MIIKCLAELLFDNECVIIPEFGAFISKENAARLDYAVHRLTPPTKEFAFNAQLTSDDGVFVNYLSERQHVTREDAASILHDFAMQSLARLEVEKELELENIGKLYYVDSQTITFVAAADANFCGDAFGLTTFTAQPIFRSETYRELKSNIEVQQKAKNTPMTVFDEIQDVEPQKITHRNYKWYRAAAYSSLVAMAMVLLGWGADKNNSELASWNPLFYSSPNEFIVKHLNEKINVRETFVIDNIPSVEVKLPAFVFNPTLKKQHVEVEQVETVTDVRRYSIIGGSFDNMAAAERCVVKFKKLGFENAEALPVNDNGNYRVEYEAVTGKDAAVIRLQEIKEKYNESAWLLRKK